jgi:hypothetical protein
MLDEVGLRGAHSHIPIVAKSGARRFPGGEVKAGGAILFSFSFEDAEGSRRGSRGQLTSRSRDVAEVVTAQP